MTPLPEDSVPVSPNDRGWASASTQALAQLEHLPLLDVGCGTGEWLSRYAQWSQGRTLVGLDVDYDRVARGARIIGDESRRIRFVVGRAEHLPFRDGCFGVVSSKVVLPYVWVKPAVAEMRRVAAPSGVALVQIHTALHYLKVAIAALGRLSPRKLAYAVWVFGNSLTFRLLGRQAALGRIRQTAPHVFLSRRFAAGLFRERGFEVENANHYAAPRSGPIFVLRAKP